MGARKGKTSLQAFWIEYNAYVQVVPNKLTLVLSEIRIQSSQWGRQVLAVSVYAVVSITQLFATTAHYIASTLSLKCLILQGVLDVAHVFVYLGCIKINSWSPIRTVGHCCSWLFVIKLQGVLTNTFLGAYHLAKKSGNFGLNSNGKVIFRKFRSEIVEYLQRYSSFSVRNATAEISLPFA